MIPSYIAPNVGELYDSAPEYIQALIYGGEVNAATATLGKIYKLPVSKYTALSDIISFILVGGLKPEDAVRAIIDMLGLSEDEAYKVAEDMEKSILEKARISILGKSSSDMVTLTFNEGRPTEDIRKEILDTSQKESVFAQGDEENKVVMAMPSPTSPKKNVFAPAGSRTQLLEQLQILETIPKDEEVEARLAKIQEQITGMQPKVEPGAENQGALAEFMPNGDEPVVEASRKTATYSKAPTRYNVDPYREVVE